MDKYTQLQLPLDTNTSIDSEVSRPTVDRVFEVENSKTGITYPIEADSPRTALVLVMHRHTWFNLVDAIAIFEDSVEYQDGHAYLYPFVVRGETQ